MKKAIKLITIFFISLFVISPFVFADGGVPDGPISSFDGIVGLFEKAASWLYTLFFIIAVVYILLAAFNYLTAGDDSSKTGKATKMIRNAVIAIIIALLSGGFSLIINNFLSSN